MNVAEHFSQSYAEARDRFLAAARACAAVISRHIHPTSSIDTRRNAKCDFTRGESSATKLGDLKQRFESRINWGP